MYQFLNKYGQSLAFGLGVIITVIFLAIIFSDPSTANLATMTPEEKFETSMFDFGLSISIGLTVLTVLAMVIFGVWQIISAPKASLKGIIGLGVVLVLMFIAYSMAAGEPDHPTIVTAVDKFESSQGVELTSGQLKFIGGSIVTALTMLAVSFVVLIVFGVRNFFK